MAEELWEDGTGRWVLTMSGASGETSFICTMVTTAVFRILPVSPFSTCRHLAHQSQEAFGMLYPIPAGALYISPCSILAPSSGKVETSDLCHLEPYKVYACHVCFARSPTLSQKKVAQIT